MWVKRNIAAFGGDPDNITIGGQSAGGGSVMAQVASPLNKGLFQKAIVDSGLELCPYEPNMFGPNLTLAEAEQIGVKFFEELGVKTLAEARKLDAFYIRDKANASRLRFGVVEDGHMITGLSNQLFMKNEVNLVPMLFGHTSTEFPSTPPAKTVEEFREYARSHFGEDAPEFLALCASYNDSLTEMKAKSQAQHLEFSIRRLAHAKAVTGDRHPMWYWVFDPEIPGWDNPGTFHSCDLWFFFETLAKCWRPFKGKHYDLSRMMCNYWANFIRSGDPNGPDADGEDMPLWKPYTEAEPNRIWFGDTVYTEAKGPRPLMAFLLRQAAKKDR
jgi:para-nitrobenzyl esterase